LANLARCLDAADNRQIDVDDDDIRLLSTGEADSFAPIAGLPADIEVATGTEQSTQTSSNVDAIVGDEDVDHDSSNPGRPRFELGCVQPSLHQNPLHRSIEGKTLRSQSRMFVQNYFMHDVDTMLFVFALIDWIACWK
jgi:hypothetical protein